MGGPGTARYCCFFAVTRAGEAGIININVTYSHQTGFIAEVEIQQGEKQMEASAVGAPRAPRKERQAGKFKENADG